MQDSEAVRIGGIDDGDDGWLTENQDLWCQNRKFEGGFVEV